MQVNLMVLSSEKDVDGRHVAIVWVRFGPTKGGIACTLAGFALLNQGVAAMYLLGLGLILLVLKYIEWGPVALWSWWLVLAPFALAAAWWAWADATGYTKRKAMEADDKRRDERRARTKAALDANYHKSHRR